MRISSLNSTETQEDLVRKESKPLRKRILLVDDQQPVRQAISLLLSLDNHTIVEATDGAEALDLFRQDRFDIVITDFEMPNMRGNELATRIKQLSPTQPIIMITAYAERLNDFSSPVNAILDKPFRLEDLRLTMAKLLP